MTKPWPSTLGLQRPATRPASTPYSIHSLSIIQSTSWELPTATFSRLSSLISPLLSPPVTSFHAFCHFTQQDMSGLGPANPYLPTALSDWQCLPAVLPPDSVGQGHSQLVVPTTGKDTGRMLVSDIPKQPWAPEGLRLPLCLPRDTGTLPQDLFTLPHLGLSLDLSIPTVRARRASPKCPLGG